MTAKTVTVDRIPETKAKAKKSMSRLPMHRKQCQNHQFLRKC